MKRLFLFLACLIQVLNSYAQTDSILSTSDLKFHSIFEKNAYLGFSQHQKDTLEAYLAVDDLLGPDDFVFLRNKFEDIWKELLTKKIASKKTNAQIKLVYTTVKERLLKNYAQGEYLSSTLLNGRYNEVTGAIVLALLFDRLQIPYQMMDSFEDFQFIANPGANEQTLDVGNPIKIRVERTPETKKELVDYLRKCGAITELEMRNHTYSELFDLKTTEQKPVSTRELLGMFYYLQSSKKLGQDDTKTGLDLAQKAYYLYPTPYVQWHFLTCLANVMSGFTVRQASDIDYLVQLHRVGYFNTESTTEIFKSIIIGQMAFEDKGALCDSMYERFVGKVPGQELHDELAFTYNLLRINQKSPTYKDIFRIDKSATIKPNIKDLNGLLEGVIQMNLENISSIKVRLDSIQSLSKQLKSPAGMETLRHLKQYNLLALAVELYKNKKGKEGEKYLQAFEAECQLPIGNEQFRKEVEYAFRELAVSAYWGQNQDLAANRRMIQRGLKLVPGSEIIQSGQYDKGQVKYVNTNPEVKYLNKEEKDNKPKTGRSIRVISKDKKEKVYSF